MAKAPKAFADMQLTAVRTLTSVLPAPALQSSVSGSTATLSWTAATPTGQSVIAGYRLYKGVTASAVNTLIGTFTTLSATDVLPAAQFYRVEAFDQFQTGNTSTVVQCVPQTQIGGQTIKNISGHWFYLDQNRNFDDQFARMQLINTRVPHCRGFQLLWRWANLESPTTPGDYSGNWAPAGTAGFQLVHRFADYARSVGKMIHLNIFTYGGNIGGPPGSVSPTFPDDMAPHYLSAPQYGTQNPAVDGEIGGCWVNSYTPNPSNVRAFVRYWDPAVKPRLLALSAGYAAEFDTHAGFGVFSHHSETTMPQIGGYSVAADKAFDLGPSGCIQLMRAHWPHTALRLWANFYGNSSDDMSLFINEAVTYRWHVGGPDTLNDAFDVHDAGTGTRTVTADFVWQGRNSDNTINPKYTNWVNRGSFGADVEPLDLDRSHDDGSSLHHLMHANKCGAYCLWWFDLRYNSSNTTPNINRTDVGSPNLLDWVESCAQGGQVTVNGATAGIALTNGNSYPPTWATNATNVPQNVLMSLQGQTVAGATGPFVNNVPQPTSPDFTQITWNPVAGATGYKIYRNGVLLASPAGTATIFSDPVATLSVNGTAGAGPQYFVANTYQYQVTSIVGGVESAKSATQSFIVYANGVQNGIGQDFTDTNIATVDYNDTTLALSGQKCVKVTVTGASGYWLPVLGNSVCLWDMWGGAFPYLYMDVKITRVGQQLTIKALRVGDVAIFDATGSTNGYSVLINNYATLANGQWVTVKIPKADYLTDRGPSGTGTPTVQNAMYKFLIQSPSGTVGEVWGFNNIRFGP